MTYANDVTGAYAALADLGDDEDQVALALTERGISGTRGDGCNCPVAVFLTGAFPDCAPEVSDGLIAFYGWLDRVDDTLLLAPYPVAEFADQFDGGAYPHLEVSNG